LKRLDLHHVSVAYTEIMSVSYTEIMCVSHTQKF